MSRSAVFDTIIAADPSEPGEDDSIIARFGWVVLVVLVAVVFARTARFGLLNDDYVLARPWSLREVLDAFHGPFDSTNYNDAYFRPVASTIFGAEWHVWGTNLWGYHLTNIALHAVATVMVWMVMRRLRVAAWAALVGAAFFALVPANVATVVYIAERTDAIVAILVCAALLCVHRYATTARLRPIVIANVLFFVALLTKEVAVALIPFAAVFWWYVRVERREPLAGGPEASGTAVDRRDTGLVAHWRKELQIAWEAVVDRDGRRGWSTVLLPLVVTFLIYLGYRTAVMPAGSFMDRLGEGFNPVNALFQGVKGTVEAVPFEISALPAAPIVAAFVVAFVLRPRSRHWRLVLLGCGGIVSGVLPLTFNGGLDPRLLYTAELGLGIAIAGLAMIVAEVFVDSRAGDRITPGRSTTTRGALARAAVGVVALALVATMAVSQVRSQNIYRPGSPVMVDGELKIWKRPEVLSVIPPRNLEIMRDHLVDAGLIDADGNITPAAGD